LNADNSQHEPFDPLAGMIDRMSGVNEIALQQNQALKKKLEHWA
jgi:hypothetical protein